MAKISAKQKSRKEAQKAAWEATRAETRAEAEFAGVVPTAFIAELLHTADGKARDKQELLWFWKYLEHGNQTQAVREAGFPGTDAAQRSRAVYLKRKYAPFIHRAMLHIGISDLPVIRATFLRVMRAYDPDARITMRKSAGDRSGDIIEWQDADPAKASPGMASAAVKAAEAYADRFGLPKGIRIEGGGPEAEEKDFRLLIDRLVQKEGLDTVRQMPTIMGHREYRGYVEGKYGRLEQVGGTVSPVVAAAIAEAEDDDALEALAGEGMPSGEAHAGVIELPGAPLPGGKLATAGGNPALGADIPAGAVGGLETSEPDYF